KEDTKTLLQQSTCHGSKTIITCDSTACIFTTNKEIDTCRSFGEPTTIHEIFPNSIFIDQSSNFDTLKIVDPSTIFYAKCDNIECMHLAEKFSITNFTSSKQQVTRYTRAEKVPKNKKNRLIIMSFQYNNTCRGDFCYSALYSNIHDSEGCLTVVDDSLS
ncbi:hypothetical protein PMAYCL1PPCAC_21364, partial [Pristionchus mayeri]